MTTPRKPKPAKTRTKAAKRRKVPASAKSEPIKSNQAAVEPDAFSDKVPSTLVPVNTLGNGLRYGLRLVPQSLTVLRNNLEVCIVYLLIPSLLVILGELLTGVNAAASPTVTVGTILLVFGTLWLALNSIMLYIFALLAVRNDQPKIPVVYRLGLRFFLRLIGLNLLIALIIALGLICFIIPGLIFARRYYLAPYYLVDYDLGIRESMQRSAAQSKPVSMAIYGMLIVTIAITGLASGLNASWRPFGAIMGLLLTTAYTFAAALLYQELQDASLEQHLAEKH